MAKEVKDKQTTKAVDKKTAYKVVREFLDKNDAKILYKVGQEVPADFDAERIKDLLNRKLIQQA